MKKKPKTGRILILLLLVFLLAQALRPAKNNGAAAGPNDIRTVVPVPDSTMAILQKSCYDCHSNHSDYPWYDQITPVNWWVTHHINEGKRELNFTEFAGYTAKRKAHKLEEIVKSIKQGWMPLDSYLWMHGDAELSEAQKQALIAWATASKKLVQP